jgi:hypothetical protein
MLHKGANAPALRLISLCDDLRKKWLKGHAAGGSLNRAERERPRMGVRGAVGRVGRWGWW